MKLLTVVTEGVLEDRLMRELRQLGVGGYTACEVHGAGASGVPRQEWEMHHVRIEILLEPDLAARVLAHLEEHYQPHYELLAWSHDVDVLGR